MSDKISSKQAVTMYDHDPDATDATDVEWVDMRDFDTFMAMVMLSVPAGGKISAFTILANAESDGGGTDVTVKTHALGSDPDAVGDYVFLECTAAEIKQAAVDAGVDSVRYVSASVTVNQAGAECVVTYIRDAAKFARAGLTADNIAA